MMRIQVIAILLFAACLHISAASYSQNVTLIEKNASLETILNKIGQQSGYDVFLQTELLAKSNKVSINLKNAPLDKVLEQVFKGQALTYSIVGHTIVLRQKSALVNPSATAAAQGTVVTGKILDADTKEPLIGASALIKGTNKAASAGLDGSFKIDINGVENPVLVISYIGYTSKEIPLSGNIALGEILLKSASQGMSEVVINGDNAIDRKTPVAVSSIGAQFIEEHLGAQDIPELLLGVPGVYATAQGGGYGDSRISIRGFTSKGGNGNVALTINGLPFNDPETGALFWSDFSGITDVTSSIQVQRGLGASKVIIPSFGGTINITTRTFDSQKGGYVSETIGSDGFDKTNLLISTGLDKNGWAATFQGGRTMGNGFADGLNVLAYNYFLNVSKVISPKQTISFNLIGGSQTHGQRQEESIADYQQAPQGIRWNYELGVKDGQQINPFNNVFSEPVASINHDWTITDKSSLSTILYATYGTGLGGEIGGAAAPRVSNLYSPFDYTAAEKLNAANADGSALTYFYGSHNDHILYGLRSTYNTLLAKYLNLSAGVDLKYYEGNHYDVVTDLLGANYVTDNYSGSPALGSASGNINDPIHQAVVGDKINFYNKDYIETEGAFAQAEYSKKSFTAFVTLSGSESENKRQDLFNYLNGSPQQTSPYVNYLTYQGKTGANYNINSQMNIFANIGYLTKPPYFGNIFENFTNQVNKAAVTEKLFSYELGYGFKASGFSATLNLYRSLYSDRSFANTFTDPTTNQIYTENIAGVNELHQGAELELKYRPIKEIQISGALSVGDWYYTNNAGPATEYNSQDVAVGTVKEVFLKGLKIGDQPQTTGALMVDVNVLPQLKIGAIYNYFANYSSNFTFSDITSANLHPYQVPNYSLWSMNADFKFKIAGLDASFIATVNNLLNTKYISDSQDSRASGLASNVSVYYGLGRVFTTGVKVKF